MYGESAKRGGGRFRFRLFPNERTKKRRRRSRRGPIAFVLLFRSVSGVGDGGVGRYHLITALTPLSPSPKKKERGEEREGVESAINYPRSIFTISFLPCFCFYGELWQLSSQDWGNTNILKTFRIIFRQETETVLIASRRCLSLPTIVLRKRKEKSPFSPFQRIKTEKNFLADKPL